jgi:hypothetical protein
MPAGLQAGGATMYQLAAAPRGIGQVLDSVFQLTRASFVILLPYAIVTSLVGAIPFAYLIWTGALDDPQRLATVGMSAGYWICVLVMVPLLFIAYGAAIVRAESIAQNQRIGLGDSISQVAPRVGTILLAGIGFVVAIALGFVLLVIPGLILMVSLYMFLPAILLDGKGSIESLTYSHKLVWGNWWRTMAIVTIALIIMYVLFLLVGLAIGLLFAFTGVDLVMMFLVNIGTTIIGGLLVMPFFTALYLEIYRDLKMRKSGGDLAARIEAAGTAR